MSKKSLKVSPAISIYHPKYPSFYDKNPLQHPEIRPYPFTNRFIQWVTTGGLAGIMMFSGNKLAAQSDSTILNNPFLLKNAGVPYQPVSFGTGMPSRLKSEEARQAIRKAFEDSGIKLEENVWLDDNKGVRLDGYSRKDQIGFVYMDYANMDKSFAKGYKKVDTKSMKPKAVLKNGKKHLESVMKDNFERFLTEKEKYVQQILRYNPTEVDKRWAEKLKQLSPTVESKELFLAYYLQRAFDTNRTLDKKTITELSDIAKVYIENRFEDSVDKLTLLRLARNFKSPKYGLEAFKNKIKFEFEKLKNIKSDKAFIQSYIIFAKFLKYDNGRFSLTKDVKYQEIKLKIMKAYPLTKWMNELAPLDDYFDRNYISLDEAKQLDRKNKSGLQFIAPICARDPMTIVRDNYFGGSKEVNEELNLLREEFNNRNGMTKEVLAQKQKELFELNKKSLIERGKDISKTKRDSIYELRKIANEKINAKYAAMELLSDAEKAEYNLKFEALKKRNRAAQKNHKEEMRLDTLRKLEEEVKMYIQWAKSQMGS